MGAEVSFAQGVKVRSLCIDPREGQSGIYFNVIISTHQEVAVCSKVAEMELSTTVNICLSAGLTVTFLPQFTQMKLKDGRKKVVSSRKGLSSKVMQ